MKSIIVNIKKRGEDTKVIITYELIEELSSKLEILQKECDTENSKMYIDFDNFKIRTL